MTGVKHMAKREVIIKDTHRGLMYRDGKLVKVLEAGRYRLPRYINLGFYQRPRVEVTVVDVRERDLTIKGQERSREIRFYLQPTISLLFHLYPYIFVAY
jgi:hypothetical protein